MNIVEIAVLLSLDSAKVGLFTPEEFSEMAAEIEKLKEKHPRLTEENSAAFFTALQQYPKPFQVVLENRALFNFFAQKNLSQKQFQNTENNTTTLAVKSFIKTFLMEELNPVVRIRELVNLF